MGNQEAPAQSPSNNLAQRIEERVSLVPNKTNNPNDCWPEGTTQNDIYFLTIKSGTPGNAKGDVPIKLPKPYGRVMVVSGDAIFVQNSVFAHLSPLGKVYGSTAIIPDGTETWFNLKANASVGGAANVLKFAQGIQVLYLDLGFEAGGSGYKFTLAFFNEDFDVSTQFFYHN